MRRFSQRNSLVTLNDINITPLLDLAFVLLIIFVITRPLLEQNVTLQLPQNMGKPDARIDRNNIRVVEITQQGNYYLNGHKYSMAQIEAELSKNPKIIVDVRADKRADWNHVLALLDACLRHHIQFGARTAPLENK
jgi:biopolymer transport protein ExbD/biopolymer transport protein TolR